MNCIITYKFNGKQMTASANDLSELCSVLKWIEWNDAELIEVKGEDNGA